MTIVWQSLFLNDFCIECFFLHGTTAQLCVCLEYFGYL